MFEYVVVGAGFAGIVIAERIATVLNEKVLLIDKRQHIGGNSYDYFNENDILVHKHGPHIFHTQLKEVWDYLSRFTEWNRYHHRVLGFINGQYIPIPFNLNSLYLLFPDSIAEMVEGQLIKKFGFNSKVLIVELRKVEDDQIKLLADFIYDNVFKNYTLKQWGNEINKLGSSVVNRVPINISKDDSYFGDCFQGIPKNGYTKMFERILNHPNIKIMLNTDFKEIMQINETEKNFTLFGNKFEGKIIYSGQIDDLFNFRFGNLPYRSLFFQFETFERDFFQQVGTVNYPNNYDFTRITEFKHLTGQRHQMTTIAREYPQDYNINSTIGNIPYYPIINDHNLELFAKYKNEAAMYNNLILIGRLAEYSYYNMDQVVDRAIKIFNDSICKLNLGKK